MVRIGLDEVTWKSAKNEITDILQSRAKNRGMISYSELASAITTASIDAHSPTLAFLLGEISAEEDAAGRGMLSVIVVHKEGDMRPGAGFFELAKTLGRNVNDLDRTWLKELRFVHRFWNVLAKGDGCCD